MTTTDYNRRLDRMALDNIGVDRWELVERIKANMARVHELYRGGADVTVRRKVDLDRFAMHRRLATDFGVERGWKLEHRSFGPSVLARGGVHNGWNYEPICNATFDHPYYYRRPDRHAVAIVAHLYAEPALLLEGTAGGIRTSLPTD